MKKYLQRTGILLLTASAALPSAGVPARPGVVHYRQPDGRVVEVLIRGDEDCHWYESPAGELLEADCDGRLVPATRAAAEKLRQRRAEPRAKRAYTDYPTTGRQKALVVLVEFADVSFRYGVDEFRSMLTEPGYSGYGAAGSARDYFIENSAGNFIPEFDVYGPVKLQHDMAYYGANDEEFAHEMVVEACRALDAEVDFSQYDRDGNGWVDNVYVFYSGYGEADGGGVNSVWPHSADIYRRGARLNLDGVQIGQYACSNELIGNTTQMVGIGTFCHEFSHVLGLPDLYSTNGTSGFTPLYYSLMDHGNYNNNGRCPCAMTAYERYYLGWCEPVELTADGSLHLETIDSNLAYRVSVPGSPEEYFLLENRQKSGWDAYLPGHGMLLWHIDYKKDDWDSNSVNNDPSHMRVDLIEADGRGDYITTGGDPFPGMYNVGEFADFRTWTSGVLPHKLLNIKESGESVTLDYNSAAALPSAPAGLEFSDIDDNFLTADWQPVAGADGYVISVQAREDGRPRPVAEWMARRVDGSVRITGLEPSTEYEVTVRAATGSRIGAPAAVVKVVTAAPGISYKAPVALPATEISQSGFTANWEPMAEAESYLIDVYTIEATSSDAVNVGFSSPLTLPDGWQSTASGTMSVSGYYGQASPSLRMTQNSEILQSAEYQAAIESLSFWLRGYRADASAALELYGLVGGDWTMLAEIKPVDNSAGSVQSFDATQLRGATAIRLRWNNPGASGSVCVDDVALGFGLTDERRYLLEGAEAGTGSSFAVGGLKPLTEYTYVIRGSKGGRLSQPSQEIRLTTSPGSGLDSAEADCAEIRLSGRTLTVSAAGSIRVLSPSGIAVASGAGTLSADLAAGVYIVATADGTRKIIVR